MSNTDKRTAALKEYQEKVKSGEYGRYYNFKFQYSRNKGQSN